MYEEIVAFARTRVSATIQKFHLGIHRFCNREPDLLLYATQQVSPRPANVVADFSIATADSVSRGVLMESDRPVTRRVPYDEDRILELCKLEQDTISINVDSGFLPIETAVCMTKHLHLSRLPKADGRWIFTKLDLNRLFESSDSSTMRIALKEDLYGRLTKSEISVSGNNIGSIYFSLVR